MDHLKTDKIRHTNWWLFSSSAFLRQSAPASLPQDTLQTKLHQQQQQVFWVPTCSSQPQEKKQRGPLGFTPEMAPSTPSSSVWRKGEGRTGALTNAVNKDHQATLPKTDGFQSVKTVRTTPLHFEIKPMQNKDKVSKDLVCCQVTPI